LLISNLSLGAFPSSTRSSPERMPKEVCLRSSSSRSGSVGQRLLILLPLAENQFLQVPMTPLFRHASKPFRSTNTSQTSTTTSLRSSSQRQTTTNPKRVSSSSRRRPSSCRCVWNNPCHPTSQNQSRERNVISSIRESSRMPAWPSAENGIRRPEARSR
jgi:hypothetical protein